MQTKGGSGFDVAQFQKLVRMFDSPYREEAVTAFNLALDNLKKSQLRFIDQIGNSAEAERAKAECAKVRAELKRVLQQCSTHKAKADELEDVIDRLHERIALMEEMALDAPGDEALDLTEPEDETELAEIPWTSTPAPVVKSRSSLPALRLPFSGIGARWAGSSFKDKMLVLACVLSAWYFWLCYRSPGHEPNFERDRLTLYVGLGWFLSGFVWSVIRTIEKVGWEGIGFKVCMILNTWVVAFTLAKGRDPWTYFYYPYPKFTPHIFGAEVIGMVGTMVALYMPSRMLLWIMDPDTKLRDWVINPCIFWLGCTSALVTMVLWDIDKAKQAHPAASPHSIIRQLRQPRKTSLSLHPSAPPVVRARVGDGKAVSS